MVSLLDIVPLEASNETVTIRGKKLEVYGISLVGIVKLFRRFPELSGMLTGGIAGVGVEKLIELVPQAVTAIIAAGLGHADDAKHEAAAARLGVEEQIDIVQAILKITIPSGVGPFVDKLNGLLGTESLLAESGIKVPDTNSPKPLNSSSPTGMEQKTSGPTLQDS